MRFPISISLRTTFPHAFTDKKTGVTTFTPAVLDMKPGETQFWRICNCTSDTILNLQLLFDGAPQIFEIVSIDGVPVNSQDGLQPGKLIPATNFVLAPAARVEILARAPGSRAVHAQFVTDYINTGPQGDEDPGGRSSPLIFPTLNGPRRRRMISCPSMSP